MSLDNRKKISELILAVRLGDDDSCASLLQMYAPLVNGLVSSTMARLPASADIDEDELRQEAAIKLYKAALTFDLGGEISFGLYAKICIKNRMISLLRRHCSEGGIATVELNDELPDNGDNADPFLKLAREEHEHELDRQLKKILSPLEYDVFNLYIDGRGPTEIARLLSVSTKTAGNAVYRMKTKIQKLLH